jgi:hypothetical protein
VVVPGFLRRDDVVAELDVGGRGRVARVLAEDEPHAAVALGVGQHLVAVIRVAPRNRPLRPEEGHLVALDQDAVDVGGVAGLVIGAVLLGALVAVLGLVLHHRVERAVAQQRVDRLPVALPVRQRAVGDLRVVEIAAVDVVVAMCVGVFVVLRVRVVMSVIVGLRGGGQAQQRGAEGEGEKVFGHGGSFRD